MFAALGLPFQTECVRLRKNIWTMKSVLTRYFVFPKGQGVVSCSRLINGGKATRQSRGSNEAQCVWLKVGEIRPQSTGTFNVSWVLIHNLGHTGLSLTGEAPEEALS